METYATTKGQILIPAALAKRTATEVVTGDKEFQVLEGQIGIAWL